MSLTAGAVHESLKLEHNLESHLYLESVRMTMMPFEVVVSLNNVELCQHVFMSGCLTVLYSNGSLWLTSQFHLVFHCISLYSIVFSSTLG